MSRKALIFAAAAALLAAPFFADEAGGQNPWRRHTVDRLPVGASTIPAVAFSPDGTRLAVGGREGLSVWDLATGKLLAQCPGHDIWITAVAFHPDGTRVASAADDGSIKVCEAATGKELLAIAGHSRTVVAMSFLAGGKQLATVTGVRLWTASTGREEVKVWDVATGKELSGFIVPSFWPGQVTFSADGQRLAGVNGEVQLQMWDVATGKRLMTAAAGPGVCFSPDGRLLASCGVNGGILLWETATRKVRLRLADDHHLRGRLAFSLDGRYLAMAGTLATEEPGGSIRTEGVLKVYDIFRGEEIASARSSGLIAESLAFGRGPDMVARGGYGFVLVGTK
jgi:WD40 repeat protein